LQDGRRVRAQAGGGLDGSLADGRFSLWPDRARIFFVGRLRHAAAIVPEGGRRPKPAPFQGAPLLHGFRRAPELFERLVCWSVRSSAVLAAGSRIQSWGPAPMLEGASRNSIPISLRVRLVSSKSATSSAICAPSGSGLRPWSWLEIR